MSESNSMYSVKVNGESVMAPSQAAAEAIASALGGTVVTVSRKEALSAVRTATKAAEYPPVLSDMLALLKDTLTIETSKASLLDGSCWRVVLQYDAEKRNWYTEVKDLALGPVVYNQTTGEKYASIVHARRAHGKSCAVKYLSNGISNNKYGKTKPAAAA